MFEKLLLSLPAVKVIAADGKFVTIDLSVNNVALPTAATADEFEDFIENYLTERRASVAFGGYNEERNLYQSEDRKVYHPAFGQGRDQWPSA